MTLHHLIHTYDNLLNSKAVTKMLIAVVNTGGTLSNGIKSPLHYSTHCTYRGNTPVNFSENSDKAAMFIVFRVEKGKTTGL